MAYMASPILDRELKKGSAELLILSLVEDQPRHGYDIGQLIELRSRGRASFQRRFALSPALSARKAGLDSRPLGGEGGATAAALLPADAGRQKDSGGAAGRLARVRGSDQPHHGNPTCLISRRRSESGLPALNLSPTRENEIVEELSQHLEDQYEQALRSRERPRKKRSQAVLRELNESDLLAPELRRIERRVPQNPVVVMGTERKTNMLGDLSQDLRYGLRMLVRNPGVHHRGRDRAGARDRREQRDL